MLDFFIPFRMALANLEPAKVEPSKMIGNTFFLKKLDGGYLAILPMKQKIFQANDGFQVFENDFELPYTSLVSIYETVESVLTGPNCEVISTSPLSEGLEGLIITLNHFADRMIHAGQEKFDPESYLIKDDVLYLKRHDRGYLAIKPSGKSITEQYFYTDKDLTPSMMLFSMDVEDLKIIVKELENLLILTEVIQPDDF